MSFKRELTAIASGDAAGAERVPSPLTSPQVPSPFLLSPETFGGRNARKGFVFQDRYIAYVLAGLLKDRENLLYVRIEAIEDLDVLVRQNGRFLERYYQMKSVEGSAAWSVRSLFTAGIFRRFLLEYISFTNLPDRPSRDIQFVFVTDGEVATEVFNLADEGTTSESLKFLFAALSTELLIRDVPSCSEHKETIRSTYFNSADAFLNTEVAPEKVTAAGDMLPIAIRQEVLGNGRKVSTILRAFLRSITYHPRAGFQQTRTAQGAPAPTMLEEATHLRLIAAFDCSEAAATSAYIFLLKEITRESEAKIPATVDRSQLLAWLRLRPRLMLEEKPSPPAPYVHLDDQLDELNGFLKGHGLVSLHGLPRIGKSQLVSSLIDSNQSYAVYFWFTFSGSEDDIATLCKQLAYWVGLRVGVWQLWDDAQANTLTVHQLLARLCDISVPNVLIVLDDSHRCGASSLLRQVCELIRGAWKGCVVIVITEEILPEIDQGGGEYMAAQGLNAKQALTFMSKSGINLADALLEFLALVLKVGGHPMMLASVVSELPARPTPEDLRKATEQLPSTTAVASFLQSLSNRIFYRVLKTDAQRSWLSRLALLDSVFDFNAASKVASLAPPIAHNPADWKYLCGQSFERNGAGLYSIPTLLRGVASENATDVGVDVVRVAAARGLLDWGSDKAREFFAFQTAVFYLVMAGSYEEAAVTLLIAMSALMNEPDTYAALRVSLISINNPVVHQMIASPNVRWHLVLTELMLIQAMTSPEVERSTSLLRMFRSIPSEAGFSFPVDLARPTIYQLVAAVRLTKCKKPTATMHDLNRFLMSSQNAVRSMMNASDTSFLDIASNMYHDSYAVPDWMDIELFHRVALRLQTVQPLRPSVLCHVYSEVGLRRKPLIDLDDLFNRHSAAYLAAGYHDAYVATELGRGTYAHEQLSMFSEGRKMVLDALSVAPHVSVETHARATVFLADTFYAQNNNGEASEKYAVVEVNPEWPDSYANHVRSRTIDSLSAVGELDKAIEYAVAALRHHHREFTPDHAALLRAKTIYLLAMQGRPSAAVPLIVGLRRLVRGASQDSLKWLYTFFSAWTVSQWKDLDLLTPRVSLKIHDCAAIHVDPDREALASWRANDQSNLKADAYLASAFQLSGRPRRSLKFLRLLSSHVPVDSAFVLRVKLANAEIRGGSPSDAALLLKAVVDSASDHNCELRAALAVLFPEGHELPEPKSKEFFESALKLFDLGESAIILRVRYAAELLKYHSVLDAKLQLSRAAALSEQIGSSELQAEVLWFKVIDHRSSFFTKQYDLMRELWRLCELLEANSDREEQKRKLPTAVRIICAGQDPATCMGMISAEVDAALSAGSDISFNFIRATCRKAVLHFGIIPAADVRE
jgi:Cap4 dsDNA endonuclease